MQVANEDVKALRIGQNTDHKPWGRASGAMDVDG